MVEKGLAAKVTLDLLQSPGFDPHVHLIPPTHPERIFAPGGIPNYVLQLCASQNA
jgi:hypothetical protein